MDKPHLYYIVFDWETGGLSANKHAVTDLAMSAIRGDNFEEIGRIEELIFPYNKKGENFSYDFDSFMIESVKKDDPNRDTKEKKNKLIENTIDFVYTKGAMDVTDITPDLINSGINIKELVDKILDLGAAAKVSNFSKAVLVGHNPDFDRNFLQQTFSVAGKLSHMPKIFHGSEDYFGNFQPHSIDTIDLAKLSWHKNQEEIPNYKLQTCVSKAGLDLVNAHRAINDVVATRDLFFHFKRKLRSSGGSVSADESRVRDSFKFEY
tara:strand:+ start:1722 stop:2513 length:792 start_codon:yes stop_codon:yes gene_type:complete